MRRVQTSRPNQPHRPNGQVMTNSVSRSFARGTIEDTSNGVTVNIQPPIAPAAAPTNASRRPNRLERFFANTFGRRSGQHRGTDRTARRRTPTDAVIIGQMNEQVASRLHGLSEMGMLGNVTLNPQQANPASTMNIDPWSSLDTPTIDPALMASLADRECPITQNTLIEMLYHQDGTPNHHAQPVLISGDTAEPTLYDYRDLSSWAHRYARTAAYRHQPNGAVTSPLTRGPIYLNRAAAPDHGAIPTIERIDPDHARRFIEGQA